MKIPVIGNKAIQFSHDSTENNQMTQNWMFPSCSSTCCPWTSDAASRVKLLITFHTAGSIPKQKHLHSTVPTRHLSMAVEHWIFPRNDSNCLYGFSFGIGFCPSVKQIAKHKGQTAHTCLKSAANFKNDKMNNSSGVLSPRRLFFGMCFFNTKCHFD